MKMLQYNARFKHDALSIDYFRYCHARHYHRRRQLAVLFNVGRDSGRTKLLA